jgi:hypothetical protein
MQVGPRGKVLHATWPNMHMSWLHNDDRSIVPGSLREPLKGHAQWKEKSKIGAVDTAMSRCAKKQSISSSIRLRDLAILRPRTEWRSAGIGYLVASKM